MKRKLADRWPEATFGTIEFIGVSDPNEPLFAICEIESLPLVEIEDERVTFPINIFQQSESPEFTSSERDADLFFEFAKTEIDEVEIKLPQSYEIDKYETPRPFQLSGIFEYVPKLGIRKQSNVLVYSRKWSLSVVSFPAKHYGTMKELFEEKWKQDGSMISLKRKSQYDEPVL